MNVLELTDTVTLHGDDHWGRRSWLTFSPYNKDGWWWKLPNGNIVQISLAITQVVKSCVTLQQAGYALYVIEHIILLRYAGLVGGVMIECNHFENSNHAIKDGCWPPADGSVAYYWDELEPYLTTTTMPVQWESLPRSSEAGCCERKVSLLPQAVGVQLWVTTDYPDVGTDTRCLQLPEDLSVLTGRIFKTKSQGMQFENMSWSEARQHVSDCDKLPRPDTMCWPSEKNPQTMIGAFTDHRTGDFLAILAIETAGNILTAANGSSYKGGHAYDYHAITDAIRGGP